MRFLALFCLSLISLAACTREVPILADIIYTGGTIYTGVEEGETVEAVSVGDGLVIYAGNMSTAIKTAKDGAQIINIGDNAFMYPGYHNGAAHLTGVGDALLNADLPEEAEGITDPEKAIVSAFKFYAEQGWTGLNTISYDADELQALAQTALKNAILLRTYNIVAPDQIFAAIDRAPSSDKLTTRAVLVEMSQYGVVPDELQVLLKSALENQVQLVFHATNTEDKDQALNSIGQAMAGYAPIVETSIMDDPDEENAPFMPRWRFEYSGDLSAEDRQKIEEFGLLSSVHTPDSSTSPVMQFAALVDQNSSLSRFEAFQVFTSSFAYAAHQEEELGTIYSGKYADFSVFNQDVLEVEGSELQNTKPLATIVAGELVWQSDDF